VQRLLGQTARRAAPRSALDCAPIAPRVSARADKAGTKAAILVSSVVG